MATGIVLCFVSALFLGVLARHWYVWTQEYQFGTRKQIREDAGCYILLAVLFLVLYVLGLNTHNLAPPNLWGAMLCILFGGVSLVALSQLGRFTRQQQWAKVS
jgi:hypothetical protein